MILNVKIVEFSYCFYAQNEPNKLVRVCRNDVCRNDVCHNDDNVVWMWQCKAPEHLITPDSDEKLKRVVQRALYGELPLIRQELEILLALAQYTLNHSKQTRAIDEKEIARIEPILRRRKTEIGDSFSETAQHEKIIENESRS